MVDYLSPVYWLFLTMTGISCSCCGAAFRDAQRPFRVPLYPYVPLVFIASSLYVFYSSLAYVRVGRSRASACCSRARAARRAEGARGRKLAHAA